MENQLLATQASHIADKYTFLMCTSEKEKGLLLSYNQFKDGNFIAASETEQKMLLTTMLLGSGTFLYEYLKANFSDFKAKVVKPNGFITTSFEVKYKFGNNEILVIRKMESKKLLLNPLAAEDPKNYHLIFAFDIKEKHVFTEVQTALTNYLKQHEISFEMKNR